MKSAPALLKLLLSLFLVAALVVTSGFAATKKYDRHRTASEEWNDALLMSGSLPDTGISVPSGAGAPLSNGTLEGSSLILGSPGVPDNWNGGPGLWNVADNWDKGVPTGTSDVTINSGTLSGKDDLVTLNVSTKINSLALGGMANGFTSELKDGGTAQMLTITNEVTVGDNGTLSLTGGSTVTAFASSSSTGLIDLENASKFNVVGNFENTGTIQTGMSPGGGNSIDVLGVLTNNNLGTFQLYGHGDFVHAFSLTNYGTIDLEGGSVLGIDGNVDNLNLIITNRVGHGGGNMIFGGFMNNEGLGQLVLQGPGDMATFSAGMLNGGLVAVQNGSTLTITGDVTNTPFSQNYGIFTGYPNKGGDTLTISGMLINSGIFALNGPKDTGTIGSLTNNGGGLVDVEGGSTLTITGNVTNYAGEPGSYGIFTSLGGTGGNTLNINGMLTNQEGDNLSSTGQVIRPPSG
jgi:hypothetical protein